MPTAQQWTLQHKPTERIKLGDDADSTFRLKSKDLEAPKDGEALLQLVFLSNDPAQRGWINKGADPRRLYHPPVKEGEVVHIVGSICKVLAVGGNGGDIKEGDFVSTTGIGWSTHAVLPVKGLRKVQPIDGYPLSVYIGALGGTTALTAYFSLVDGLQLKEGQSILISGAAGGVGSVAVQLAKHKYKAKLVVGMAGTKEKCEWIKKLGADVAINYKDDDWVEQLTKATPDFLDCFLDNVGGKQLSAALSRMARFGRISVIGAISAYNGESLHQPEIANWFEVIQMRLNLKGMIVTDYYSRFGEAQKDLMQAYKDGHLTLEGSETVVEADFSEVPAVWDKLFEGHNRGKFVTKIKGVQV